MDTQVIKNEEKQRCIQAIKSVMAEWAVVTDIDNPVSISDIEKDLLNRIEVPF